MVAWIGITTGLPSKIQKPIFIHKDVSEYVRTGNVYQHCKLQQLSPLGSWVSALYAPMREGRRRLHRSPSPLQERIPIRSSRNGSGVFRFEKRMCVGSEQNPTTNCSYDLVCRTYFSLVMVLSTWWASKCGIRPSQLGCNV